MTDTLERESPGAVDEPPKPQLKPGQVRCGVCGDGVSKQNLSRHRESAHGIVNTGGRPAKAKSSAGAGPLPSFRTQVEMLYRLGGQVTAQRLPVTGNTIVVQAPACAAAWDAFLDRYPAVKEWMEKAGVAGDLVTLFVAHYPILEAARGELAERQRQTTDYNAQAGATEPIG